MTKNVAYLDFMRFRRMFFAFSAMLLATSLISLIVFGLKPAIDFTGGTLIELEEPTEGLFSQDLIASILPEDADIASFQRTDQSSIVIRTKPITAQENETFKFNLASQSGLLNLEEATISGFIQTPINELRFETVGPTLGRELLNKTIVAIILAATAIMAFVTFRFNEIKYGASAIIAMFHDSIILLGTFSLLGHFFQVEVDTLFVTAVLTTLSFSVHDTIVVFDRIRENRRVYSKLGFYDIVNKSVTETMSRSINNSMTIIFMLLALYLLGGETTKWFVFALLIGTIAGTYSSPFTAAPVLILWDTLSKRRSKKSR
jgi:preprotein translocase subunit SecF